MARLRHGGKVTRKQGRRNAKIFDFLFFSLSYVPALGHDEAGY